VQVFNNRPLAAFCFVFVCVSVAAFAFCGIVKIIVGIMAFAFALAFFVIYIISKRKSSKIAYSILCLIFAFLAISQSYIYFNVLYSHCNKYSGGVHTIVGTVTELESSGDFYTGYSIKLDTIDGEKVSGKLLLECEYVCVLVGGEKIQADTEIYAINDKINVTYNISSMIANGYMLYGVSTNETDYNVIGYEKNIFKDFFRELNLRFSSKLINDIKGDAGALSAALLLGNKEALSDDISGNFRKVGASHILALSGMHMSIVIGAFDLILRKLRIHKNIRCAVVGACALSYLALTGFRISAMRSVFMILAVYACYYFATEGDSITTLLGILMLFILITPYAVCDIGMWLSFMATFGILVVSSHISLFCTKIEKPFSGKFFIQKFLRYLISGILISFVAVLSVSLINCLCFGEYALLTPISNILVIPFAYLILIFSLLYLVFSGIPFIGSVVVGIIRLLSGIILGIIDKMSEVRNGIVNLNYLQVKIIVFIMVLLLIVSLFLNFKRKIRLLIVPVTSVLLIFVFICSAQYLNSSEINATYLKNKQNEEIVLTSGNKAVICDFSDGSSTNLNLAYSEVCNNNISEVEVLILSHYHERHLMSFKKLNCVTNIRNLYLPLPINEREYYIMLDLVRYAEEENVAVSIYDSQSELFVFGDTSISFISHTYINRSTHPTVAMKISNNDGCIVYLGGSVQETETAAVLDEFSSEADWLIFGIHGPVTKSECEISTVSPMMNILVCDDSILEYIYFPDEYLYGFSNTSNIIVGAEKYKMVIYKTK